MMHRLALIKRWWQLLVIVLTPLIFLPLPLIYPTIQSRCAYVVIVLTIYWVSEAMPYAVTSLLPLAFFPLGGILPGDEVGLNYFKDITTLFVGSMTLAQAMEHVRLHRRLALFVLSFVGSSVKWSMAGLMAVTAFLSMWINNSAATSIMIPAAIAIVEELERHQRETPIITNNQIRRPSREILPVESSVIFDVKTSIGEQHVTISPDRKDQTHATEEISQLQRGTSSNHVDYRQLKTGFLIAVAYSAAIGGLATLVGTGPNIFVKGFTDEFYSTGRHLLEISFTNFLLFALPIGIVMLILACLWLQLLYNRRELSPWRKKDAAELASEKHLKSVLQEQYQELGRPSWQEWTVAILFLCMVVLWITRDFSSSPGWEIIFRKNYVTDGTVALLIGSLSLILPNQNPFRKQWEYHPILKWEQLSKKFPWGVFMLQGAGLAIADGFKASNLSDTIGSFLQFLVGTSPLTIIFITILISAIFTEFTSNLACASILFPILDSIAKSSDIHPARLILPSCMAVSLSFMLPIATPPNAMIFSSGNVRILDLVKVGLGMKIIGMGIILFFSMFLLGPVFRIGELAPLFNNASLLNNTNVLLVL